ncbi:hypothetical protein GOBAR_DD15960 [Gossypium barbadense]|nr:hypothetical protein GOBAR_DD15960 [Gossypium barbadense]
MDAKNAIGALKDSTKVGLARGVEVAIVKATDHKEVVPKEKHVKTILAAVSNRSDAAFCIHTLLKRLAKTHTWTVPPYLITQPQLLRIHHSANPHNNFLRLNTPDLLDQLPVLQELLHHLLNCKIAGESVKLYIAITDGILNLIDRYFRMQHHHAVRALEIYRKAGEQVSLLSEFFEICRGLHYGQGQKYLKIKPLPESFLIAMEEYVKETPEVLALLYTSDLHAIFQITKDEGAAPAETPAPVSDLLTDDVQEKSVTSSDKTQSEPRQAVGKLDIADLMCFDEPSEEGTELNENNPLALAIVKSESPPYAENVGSSAPAFTSWELGLCDAPVSNGAAVADNKMVSPNWQLEQINTTQFINNKSTNGLQLRHASTATIHHATAASYDHGCLPFNQPFSCGKLQPESHILSDMKMAVIAPQQTDLKQQPTLAMVGYNSTKPTGNPFDM